MKGVGSVLIAHGVLAAPSVDPKYADLVKEAAGSAPCYLPLDVLFLQDTTESFTDDLPNVMNELPSMIAAINAANPNSYFGVSEFKDKPYQPFGWDTDYCYLLHESLSADVDAVIAAYSELYASGGDDLPESQYQACIDAILDHSTGWRPTTQQGGPAGAHVIVMSTDAVPHYEGDYAVADVPAFLIPNDGQVTQGNLTYDCNNKRYPTYQQFGDAFFNNPLTYLAILTPGDDPNVVSVYQWINEGLLNQSAAFYQIISNDSSDFIIGVLEALRSVTETVCAITTTTEETTSVQSTTLTTTITAIDTSTPATPTTTQSTAPETTSTIMDTTTATIATTTTSSTETILTESTSVPTTRIPTTTETTISETTSRVTTESTGTPVTIHDITSTQTTTSSSGPSTETAISESSTTTLSTTPATETAIPSTTSVTETTVPSTTGKPCPPCPTCPPGPVACPPCYCNNEIVIRVSGKPKHIEADFVYRMKMRALGGA